VTQGPATAAQALTQLREKGLLTQERIRLLLSSTVASRRTRILDALGLSPPQNEKPPPPVRGVVRIPVDDDGWEIAPTP